MEITQRMYQTGLWIWAFAATLGEMDAVRVTGATDLPNQSIEHRSMCPKEAQGGRIYDLSSSGGQRLCDGVPNGRPPRKGVNVSRHMWFYLTRSPPAPVRCAQQVPILTIHTASNPESFNPSASDVVD